MASAMAMQQRVSSDRKNRLYSAFYLPLVILIMVVIGHGLAWGYAHHGTAAVSRISYIMAVALSLWLWIWFGAQGVVLLMGERVSSEDIGIHLLALAGPVLLVMQLVCNAHTGANQLHLNPYEKGKIVARDIGLEQTKRRIIGLKQRNADITRRVERLETQIRMLQEEARSNGHIVYLLMRRSGLM